MKKTILLVACIFVMTGCFAKDNVDNLNKGNSSMYEMILSEGNYVIIDARSEKDYNKGHVVNSVNIPLKELKNKIGEYTSKNIFVYSSSKSSSYDAYKAIKDLGYSVYDLGSYDGIDMEKTN